MKFINRNDELVDIHRKWKEKNSHLIIVYGKRRVGKTELIKQFIKDKNAIYFLADKRSINEQLKELGRIIGRFFSDMILEKKGFSDWVEVFQYVKEKTKNKFIFAIDEYPYMVEIDRATSSLFQKGWDEYLKDSNIFMILSGSSISMMESEALIYKSPLYGRRTGQIFLKPLSFAQSWKFFPEKSFEDFLKIFAILGGMPAYLIQFSKSISLEHNIIQKILGRTEFLHNEVEFVLKEELREPKNYLSILKAIAFGKRKFGEIANDIGFQKNALTKYLNTLEKLQIILKEIPPTENKPLKSRKGLYKISDNFFRFWFKFVFSNKSDLELSKFDAVLGEIKRNFNLLEAMTYEEVCQEILQDNQGKIFPFEKIGRWWEKNEEIDIIGVNSMENKIIFGECKWSNKLIGINIYKDLKRKAVLVDWQKSKRKEYYILFSRKGFTNEMLKTAKKENIFLVEKDRLLYSA